MAVASNRVLILPPNGFCLFLSDHDDKSTFYDHWEHLLDKDAFVKEFDCIDYKDVPYYQKFSSDIQWFDGILEDDNVKCYELSHDFQRRDRNWGAQEFDVEFCAFGKVNNKEEFQNFVLNRKKVDLNSEKQFIHFPRNFYAQPLYNVYLDGDSRLEVMKRIERGVRLQQRYWDEAEKLVPKDFDAIHIRRGDFKHVHNELINQQYMMMREMIEGRIRKDVPLFIATDERDRDVFEDILEDYDNVIFLEDLTGVHTDYYLVDYSDQNRIAELSRAMALDMIIPTFAKTFLGSKISTFSNYINIMRGYKGMDDYTLEGVNYNYRHREPYKNWVWETNQYLWEVIVPELYYETKS